MGFLGAFAGEATGATGEATNFVPLLPLGALAAAFFPAPLTRGALAVVAVGVDGVVGVVTVVGIDTGTAAVGTAIGAATGIAVGGAVGTRN